MGDDVIIKLDLNTDIVQTHIRNSRLVNELLAISGFHGIFFGSERMIFLLCHNAGWDYCTGMIETIFYSIFGKSMTHLYKIILVKTNGKT